MELTPQQQSAIRSAFQQYIRDTQRKSFYDRGVLDFLKMYQALPVYSDLDGTLALLETGEVILCHHNQVINTSAEWRYVTDNTNKTIAYICAYKAYPTLSFLAPDRSHASVDCDACYGTGKVKPFGPQAELICNKCSGLGWLPRLDILAL